MQENTSAIVSADLSRFFSELVFEVADSRSASVSPITLNYVSSVLVDFSETAKFFIQDNVKFPILADMLAEAMKSDFYRRVKVLRHLGDTSLMMSGYFPEALNKRTVGLSYYNQMGETAYGHLSKLTDHHNLFGELQSEFSQLVDLLGHVAASLKTEGLEVEEILNVYDETNNKKVLEVLQRRGIYPLDHSRRSGD